MVKKAKRGKLRKAKEKGSFAQELKKSVKKAEKAIKRFEESSRVDPKILKEPMTI
ncbi:MAG: hypothetical protein NT116_00865 [Candidatus Parcubacteria bacterium]|nr:hypothetical protein [Candidatus Parcubacteria bacterium]